MSTRHLIIIFMYRSFHTFHFGVVYLRYNIHTHPTPPENLKLSGHIISNPSKFNILTGIEVFLSFQQTFRGFRVELDRVSIEVNRVFDTHSLYIYAIHYK